MDLDAADGAIFIAQFSDSLFAHWSSLTDEEFGRLHRWFGFQVRLQGTPGRGWQRHRSLLAAFSMPEDYGAAASCNHKVTELHGHQIANPAAGIEE